MSYLKKAILCVTLSMLFLSPLFAQEEAESPISFAQINRQLADSYLQLDVGVEVPLYFTDKTGDQVFQALEKTSVGFLGGIELGVYLHKSVRIGLHFDTSFSISKAQLFANFYSLTARTSYIIHIRQAEIPIFLDLGVHVSSYRNNSHADFILRAGTGFLWNFNSTWGFGFNALYKFVPQIYYSTTPPPSASRLGHFFETVLLVKYTF